MKKKNYILITAALLSAVSVFISGCSVLTEVEASTNPANTEMSTESISLAARENESDDGVSRLEKIKESISPVLAEISQIPTKNTNRNNNASKFRIK